MTTQFKAGDKVRNLNDVGRAWRGPALDEVVTVQRAVVLEGKQFLAFEEYLPAFPHHLRDAHSYARVAEPQEFVVTRVYPNGGYGVTHYFDTEQEAREYLRKAGNSDGGYKFSRLVDSQMLKVQEETTVTRSVVPA